MIKVKVILQPKDIFMGGISNIFVLEYSTYMKNDKILHFTVHASALTLVDINCWSHGGILLCCDICLFKPPYM